MERVELTVRGDDARDLPTAIHGVSEERTVGYQGDGFGVIVTERFYLRNNSNMQATIIFDLVDETTCKVVIVAGGGGAGLLQMTFGSEGHAASKFINELEDFCDAHDLEVERE